MGLRSKLELLQARTGFSQLTSLQNPSFPIMGTQNLGETSTRLKKSHGIQGKREEFKPRLSLEGGGQGQTSPGLKLSFPAPFPGAGSHPWTTPTHPARKVAWMCFSWDGATGIKEVFPEPALPPGVSAPGREPGGTFPGECGAPPLLVPAGDSTWSNACY